MSVASELQIPHKVVQHTGKAFGKLAHHLQVYQEVEERGCCQAQNEAGGAGYPDGEAQNVQGQVESYGMLRFNTECGLPPEAMLRDREALRRLCADGI